MPPSGDAVSEQFVFDVQLLAGLDESLTDVPFEPEVDLVIPRSRLDWHRRVKLEVPDADVVDAIPGRVTILIEAVETDSRGDACCVTEGPSEIVDEALRGSGHLHEEEAPKQRAFIDELGTAGVLWLPNEDLEDYYLWNHAAASMQEAN